MKTRGKSPAVVELTELEDELREANRRMEECVASEANGGDVKTAREGYKRASQRVEELRPAVEHVRAVVGVRRKAEAAAQAARHRESELVSTAVRQALSGGKFVQVGRLDPELWPRAWAAYKQELRVWRDRRIADLTDAEGQVPAATGPAIANADRLLARSIDDLCRETGERVRALVEA